MNSLNLKGVNTYDLLLKKYAAGVITVAISRDHPSLVNTLKDTLDVKYVKELTASSYIWDNIHDESFVGVGYALRVANTGTTNVEYVDRFGNTQTVEVKTGNAFVCIETPQDDVARWVFVDDDEVVVTVENKAATFGWGQTVTVATIQGKNITLTAPADPAVGDVSQVTYDSNNVLQSISGSTKKYLKLPKVYAKYDPADGNARGLYVRYWDAAGVEQNDTIATVENLQQIFGISDIQDDVNAIKSKIPSQASSSNQLADKEYVNNGISTATATFINSYNLVKPVANGGLGLHVGDSETDIANALASVTASHNPDNNDYAFVEIPTNDSTPTQIEKVDRWKYNGTDWLREYTLNNSGFNTGQWDTINSGLTGADKTKLDALPTNAQLTTTLAGKVDKVTGKGLSTNDFTTPEKTKLASAIVGATSGTNPVVGTVKVMTSAEYYALTSFDANTEYIVI